MGFLRMVADRKHPRVVVTGMGVTTPIGQSVADFWDALAAGQCGIQPIEGIAEDELNRLSVRIAGQVRGFDHADRLAGWKHDKSIMHSSRYCWLAAAAADEAVRQSGLEVPVPDPHRVACIVGSAVGGQINSEIAGRDLYLRNKRAVHPMLLPRIVASSASAHIGIEHGIRGPTYAICSAGASATHSIGIGYDYIRHGMCDVAIVGGSESAITYTALLACEALGFLSPEGCFPFAQRRNGTVFGEGAGILVLETEAHARARDADVLAEICGFGMTGGGEDMLRPDVESSSAAMRMAIDDAGISPRDIDYVNANATGSRLGDRDETAAIKTTFGNHAKSLCVSSTKSMHANLIGASGAVEAVACIKAMETGLVPPTMGLDEADPECDLDYVPHCAREKQIGYAMSNSFALGEMNASLVFGPPPG